MKKLIFTALSLSVMGSAFAQKLTYPVYPSVKSATKIERNQHKSFSKAGVDVADWYSVASIISKSNIENSLDAAITFMYPDTNAKMIYDNNGSPEVQYPTWQSVGHVIDPKDDLIQLTDNPGIQISQYVSYKLDSIRFPFLYVRNVDMVDDGQGGMQDVVDTLYVFFYRGNQITKTTFTGGTNPNKTAVVGYNPATKSARNFFDCDTILLTRNDSTSVFPTNGFESSFSSKIMTLPAPAGVAINANKGREVNNLVGATLVFKPMLPTLYNGNQDTTILLLQDDPASHPGAKRGNYFGFHYIRNTSEDIKWNNPTYYNISQLAVKWNSYGQEPNWNNVYVSGNAFTSELFIDMDFFITTTSGNVGINEIKNDQFALSNIYPNPSMTGTTASLAFNLKAAADVKISILNLVGQEVKTVMNKNYTAGEHNTSLDLAGFKAGIYLVNMTVNGVSQTKKLTITE